jgi:hypothetical protein
VLIASALRKMLDARPRALVNPFEDALARQFVLFTETGVLWSPLPVTFPGPVWATMPGANVKQFYKVCAFSSGPDSAVMLACSATGEICVIKFRCRLVAGM